MNVEKENQKNLLLTVLIPVYNGGRYLNHLLRLFEHFLQESSCPFTSSLEILVVDNVSTDDTLEIAQAYSKTIECLRVHHETTHVRSAEENIFRSFRYCQGEYVWTLGVDDIPIFGNLERALSILAKNEVDFLLSNTSAINKNEIPISTSAFEMDTEILEKSIVDLTGELGAWNVLAAMSCQILRTKWVSDYDLNRLIQKTSAVYSHVVAYLEIFQKKKTQVVNFPLVFYRVDPNPLHWIRAATQMGVFDNFFWTLGFVRQIKYLEEKHVINRQFFFYSLEINEKSIIFRPVWIVIEKLFEQLRKLPGSKKFLGSKSRKRNLLSPSDFKEITDFIQERDPFCRSLVWSITSLYEKLMAGERSLTPLWEETIKIYDSYRYGFLFSPFFIEKYNSFEIYKIQNKFYAIQSDQKKLLLEIMKHVEKKSIPPFFFATEDLQELHAHIEERDQNSEEDGGKLHEFEKVRAYRSTKDREEDLGRLQSLISRERSKDEANREFLEARYQALISSTSWELTGPIRVFARIAQGSLRKLKLLIKKFRG